MIARKGDKLGVINQEGSIIIPIQQKIIKESNGYFWVNGETTSDKKYWIYNYDGERLSTEPFYTFDFRLPFIGTEINNYSIVKYNILDSAFNKILPFDYDFNSYGSNKNYCNLGLYVKIGYNWPAGHILFDLVNNQWHNIVYSDIDYKRPELLFCCRPKTALTVEQFLALQSEEKEVYIGNEEVLDAYLDFNLILTVNLNEYKELKPISQDLFFCYSVQSDKYGIIDSKGVLVPFIYDNISDNGNVILARRSSRRDDFHKYEYYDIYNREGRCIGQDVFNHPEDSLFNYDSFQGFIIKRHGFACLFLYDYYGQHLCDIISIERWRPSWYLIKNKDSLYGIIDQKGKILYPCSALNIAREDNFFKVQDVSKNWGILNASMELIVPFIYKEDDLRIFRQYVMAQDSFYNELGEEISPPEDIIEQGYCRCFYGRKNSKGELITIDKYSKIGKYKYGYAPACNKEEKWGLLDKNGDEVYPFVFSDIKEVYPGGFAQVENREGFCLVNKEGKPLFPFGYTDKDENKKYITPDDEKRTFIITHNNKNGVMGPGYQIIVPCDYRIPSLDVYTQEELFKKGFLTYYDSYEDESLVGLLSYSPFKPVIPCQYKSITLYDNSIDYSVDYDLYNYEGPILFRCELGNDKESIISTDGSILYNTEDGKIKLIFGDFIVETDSRSVRDECEHHCYIYSISKREIVAKYILAGYFDGKYLQVLGEKGWGLFDIELGKEAISCNYILKLFDKFKIFDRSFFPSEGLIAAHKANQCGYIDLEENWVIEVNPLFAEEVDVGPFSEGLAAVEVNGKWGYINKDHQFVIQPKYIAARPFSEGLAVVKTFKNYGYIDYTGKEIIYYNYLSAESFHEGVAEVSTKDGQGTISKSGRHIDWEEYKTSWGASDDYTDEDLAEAMGWESYDDAAAFYF